MKLAHIVIPAERTPPPPSSLCVIAVTIRRAGGGKRERKVGGRKGEGGGIDEGSQKSDKRAQTIPLLVPLVLKYQEGIYHELCCLGYTRDGL